ncbi:MAG: SRPBCC domain-containing protein [Bacteroidales bacterium]|nr:SRPBCC domain-containing protein [Bacteroidales bacterium]
MRKELTTKIQINATPEKVWSVLSDFENYPKWNPFITSIKGNVIMGKKVTVRLVPPGNKGMTIRPEIMSIVPNKHLSWQGRLLVKGVFDGVHSFDLIENLNGTTTFVHSEKFNGLLVPLMKKFIDQQVKSGFESMNQNLKETVEQTD